MPSCNPCTDFVTPGLRGWSGSARCRKLRCKLACCTPKAGSISTLDIIAGACALLALSPLLLTVIVLIKLEDRGPIFFRQTRVGLRGRHFGMWKFRSMVIDAERQKRKLLDLSHRDGPHFKVKNDPRVTRFGRFLRRFSLDELPQLINVLRGEMAIIGEKTGQTTLTLHSKCADKTYPIEVVATCMPSESALTPRCCAQATPPSATACKATGPATGSPFSAP